MVAKTIGPRLTSLDVISGLLWVLAIMLAVSAYKFTEDLSISETLILIGYILLFRFVVLGLPVYAVWKIVRSRRD